MQTLTSGQQTLVDDLHALVAGTSPQDRHAIFPRLRENRRSSQRQARRLRRSAPPRCQTGAQHRRRFPATAGRAGASAFGRSFMQMSGREHKKIGIVRQGCAPPARCVVSGLIQLGAGDRGAPGRGPPMGQPINLREQYATWVPLLAITALTDLPEAGTPRLVRTIVAGARLASRTRGARAAFRRAVRLFLEADHRAAPPRQATGDLLSDLVTTRVRRLRRSRTRSSPTRSSCWRPASRRPSRC